MSDKSNLIGEDEIKKILPSYDQMLEQIRKFNESSKKRFNPNQNDKGSWTEDEQTYNYISILGKRGSGKTSVIRTLMNRICQDNKNIVLPMIIPEKMSPTSTLMSTILGMFKGIVEKFSKDSEDKFCWDEKKDELNQKYQDLLKKYCYIRPEYRDILINQYTSEHNYIYKSSEIFDSDAKFIKAFNEFIYELIQANQMKNKDSKYSYTIFIVIDDIDLCAEHCSDIVNALLAYLGNPHIVTILSGDFDTFTETLVHDFLKRDNILNGDLLEKNLSDYGTILESRKKLAFEFLRKIMPPVYRYNLRLWSDKERWNFKSKGTTLFDLLNNEVFQKYNISQMFYYYNFYENQVNGKLKPIYQMFNMFDDTSRGLENVCNALQNTINVLKKKDNDEYKKFCSIKLLIETIVNSNYLLCNMSEYIFSNIIVFGDSIQNTIISNNAAYNKVEQIEESNNKDKYIKVYAIISLTLFAFHLKNSDVNDNSLLRNINSEFAFNIVDEYYAKVSKNSYCYGQVIADSPQQSFTQILNLETYIIKYINASDIWYNLTNKVVRSSEYPYYPQKHTRWFTNLTSTQFCVFYDVFIDLINDKNIQFYLDNSVIIPYLLFYVCKSYDKVHKYITNNEYQDENRNILIYNVLFYNFSNNPHFLSILLKITLIIYFSYKFNLSIYGNIMTPYNFLLLSNTLAEIESFKKITVEDNGVYKIISLMEKQNEYNKILSKQDKILLEKAVKIDSNNGWDEITYEDEIIKAVVKKIDGIMENINIFKKDIKKDIKKDNCITNDSIELTSKITNVDINNSENNYILDFPFSVDEKIKKCCEIFKGYDNVKLSDLKALYKKYEDSCTKTINDNKVKDIESSVVWFHIYIRFINSIYRDNSIINGSNKMNSFVSEIKTYLNQMLLDEK